MIQQSNLVLAKQGDTQAIAHIVGYFLKDKNLKDKNIKVQANIQNGCLFLILESSAPLEKVVTLHTIRKLLNTLDIPQVKTAKIQSKLEGVAKADWLRDIKLVAPVKSQSGKSQIEEKAIALPATNSPQKQLPTSPETQANNPSENQPESTNIFLKESRWSPWFPYPSSWLRTLGLMTGLFVIVRIIMYWNIRLIRWNPSAAGSLTLVTLIILFAYIHHIVFAKETPSFKVFLPTPRSWWEGIYAAIVCITASLICIIIILPFVLIPDCDLLSTRFARLCLRSIDSYYSYRYRYLEALFLVGFIMWAFSAAYLYQIEFLIRKNFSMQKFVKFLLIGFMAFSLSIFASFAIRNYQPIQGFLQSLIAENIERIASVLPSPQAPTPTSSTSTVTPPVTSTPLPVTSTPPPVTSTTTLPNLPETVIVPATIASPMQTDPFVLGTENALKASKLVQVAKTKAEWQKVADDWTSAVTFMQVVPASHPKYAIAQQKVLEYQANLDYAKRAGALAVN